MWHFYRESICTACECNFSFTYLRLYHTPTHTHTPPCFTHSFLISSCLSDFSTSRHPLFTFLLLCDSTVSPGNMSGHLSVLITLYQFSFFTGMSKIPFFFKLCVTVSLRHPLCFPQSFTFEVPCPLLAGLVLQLKHILWCMRQWHAGHLQFPTLLVQQYKWDDLVVVKQPHGLSVNSAHHLHLGLSESL